jgi:mono/diheme cytochrome c family protein
MVVNILLLIVLILITVGFIALARGAWRNRHAWIRWPGVFLSGLLALVFAALSVIGVIGLVRLNVAPYQYATVNIPVTGASDQVARGERLAHLCQGCHSTTGGLPLDGSKGNFVEGGPPVGVLYAPNLTPSGPLKNWSDAEVARAIREGVDNQGRPLLIMPSVTFHTFSDADVAAIVAYLRSQPAANNPTPAKNVNLLAAAFVGSGMFPTSAQPPITQPVNAPAQGTADYGSYLVHSAGCVDCHGQSFTGTPPGGFGPPPAPNLTTVVPKWSQQDFINLFHTGKDPSGRQISTEMPYKDFVEAFSDSELADMYTYLHGLQPMADYSK